MDTETDDQDRQRAGCNKLVILHPLTLSLPLYASIRELHLKGGASGVETHCKVVSLMSKWSCSIYPKPFWFLKGSLLSPSFQFWYPSFTQQPGRLIMESNPASASFQVEFPYWGIECQYIDNNNNIKRRYLHENVEQAETAGIGGGKTLIICPYYIVWCKIAKAHT